METMHLVTSTDGTGIAWCESGHGPNLVLVHGVSADHSRWTNVVPRLAEHFTVCAVDRRGRGGSGDSTAYSVEQEFDDIAAVCNSLDPPVYLLGHSHGGLFALGAAQRSSIISKLILYEPSINLGKPLVPSELTTRMEEMLAEGDREGALVTLFREVVQVTEAELEALRAEPSWQGRLESVHTIPRELAGDLPYAEEFSGVTTPTLLLTGELSPRDEIAATQAVHAALPNSRIVVMNGQGHAAMTTGPDLFIGEILRFLRD